MYGFPRNSPSSSSSSAGNYDSLVDGLLSALLTGSSRLPNGSSSSTLGRRSDPLVDMLSSALLPDNSRTFTSSSMYGRSPLGGMSSSGIDALLALTMTKCIDDLMLPLQKKEETTTTVETKYQALKKLEKSIENERQKLEKSTEEFSKYSKTEDDIVKTLAEQEGGLNIAIMMYENKIISILLSSLIMKVSIEESKFKISKLEKQLEADSVAFKKFVREQLPAVDESSNIEEIYQVYQTQKQQTDTVPPTTKDTTSSLPTVDELKLLVKEASESSSEYSDSESDFEDA